MVIDGEGWSQQIILSNVDTPDGDDTLDRITEVTATGTLSFYTKDGQPWVVELKDRGKNSTFSVNLLPGQTAVYETVVHNYQQVLGWAKLEQTESHPFGGASSGGLGMVLG
jgi:hypothetical protein